MRRQQGLVFQSILNGAKCTRLPSEWQGFPEAKLAVLRELLALVSASLMAALLELAGTVTASKGRCSGACLQNATDEPQASRGFRQALASRSFVRKEAVKSVFPE